LWGKKIDAVIFCQRFHFDTVDINQMQAERSQRQEPSFAISTHTR
jgi:hypothetical protein